MPTSADPISAVLQRTFHGSEGSNNGVPNTVRGLIRGGNSASARLDLGLQARSLLSNGGDQNSAASLVHFDPPTRHLASSPLNNYKNTKSRIIILNPQAKTSTSNGEESTNNAKGTNGCNSESIPRPRTVLFSRSNIEVGYRSLRPAGAGMSNVGNTCYLNSTLQALFHTPALFNYLVHDPHQCSSSFSSGCCTICALAMTLKDTLRSSVIKPNRVYEKLKTICKHMVHGRQEDAHEFLRYLIDSLQKSFLSSSSSNQHQLDNASKETTPFNQIFGGYMRQDVTCLRCKHVSTTFQHFMDILVDIRQVSTLEEALAQFFRPERLGNDGAANMYKCEKCKVKVPARRRCLVERAPAVLCIQLKRFSLMGGKISKPVQLSRTISMDQYVHNSTSRQQYKLVSMITHVGPSPNCGHYTAIGEAANGQFFQFDDSSVRPISLGQVLNTASYVVFYEMTQSSWTSQTCNGTNNRQQPQVVPRTTATVQQPSLLVSKNKVNVMANKLGVVKSAAVAAASSLVRTVSSTKKGLLVPYGADATDSDSDGGYKEVKKMPTAFVPRSVQVKAMQQQSKSGAWTVTDLDQHNPSVNSDNSTGSTNGTWMVKDAKENNIVRHQSNGTTNGSTSPSSSCSEQKKRKSFGYSSFSSRKRSSLDESFSGDVQYNNKVEDYDAELDRGRTKKVKKADNNHYYNGSNGNPFQNHQNYQYNNRSSSSNGRWEGPGDNNGQHSRNRSWSSSSHRDHNYHAHGRQQHHKYNRGDGGRRRSSFGGSEFRDKHRSGFNNRSFSGGREHRDNYRHHHHYNNHHSSHHFKR